MEKIVDQEIQFETIVNANKDNIYRICRYYVRQEDEQKDVYQEILIHIWNNLKTFEGKSKISTWIYRIAVNTCLGYVKSAKRRTKLIEPSNEGTEEKLHNHPAEETTPGLDRELQLLEESITQLPPVERSLMSLYLEDLSTFEISEILGISEANTRVKIHRIKKTLKEMMEKEHGYR